MDKNEFDRIALRVTEIFGIVVKRQRLQNGAESTRSLRQ